MTEFQFTNPNISLEKIDILRERLGISYSTAKEALEKTNGDVIEALVFLEEEQVKANDISHKVLGRIRGVLTKGNATRVRIKRDGKTVAEIPATVGAIGILGTIAYTPLAIIGAIGSVTAMFNRYTLEVEKKNGEVEEHPLMATDLMDNTTNEKTL
ncbi:MAG: DUF4342 domain-containing protein [Bacillota bacterium]|nr:DUF4342 domain-containing protein [Bacillota bacterium]